MPFEKGNQYATGGNRPGAGRKANKWCVMWEEAVREEITPEVMRSLVRATVTAATVGGDMRAAALLLDRVLGKVPQSILAEEEEDADGSQFDLSKLTDEELTQWMGFMEKVSPPGALEAVAADVERDYHPLPK